MNRFLNAKLSSPPSMKMLIPTSSRSALKENQRSLLSKRSYRSVPVTAQNEKFPLYHLSAITEKQTTNKTEGLGSF